MDSASFHYTLRDLIVQRKTADELRGALHVAFGWERPPALHLGGSPAQMGGSLPPKRGFSSAAFFQTDSSASWSPIWPYVSALQNTNSTF